MVARWSPEGKPIRCLPSEHGIRDRKQIATACACDAERAGGSVGVHIQVSAAALAERLDQIEVGRRVDPFQGNSGRRLALKPEQSRQLGIGVDGCADRIETGRAFRVARRCVGGVIVTEGIDGHGRLL